MFYALVATISIVDYVIRQYGSSEDFDKTEGITNDVL